MAVRLLQFILVASCIAFPALATAQHGDISDNVRFEDDLNPNEFMMTARVRAVTIPNFVLGVFFDEHASHWDGDQRNLSYGGEFVWRRGNDFELGVALDYADLSMSSEFWLDEGDDPHAADWTEVDMQVFSVVFSAYWFWDVQPWLTPFLGGGIGPGFILGEVVRYSPHADSPCQQNLGSDAGFAPPECFNPNGEPSEDAVDFESRDVEQDIPPVVPMINLTAGIRFNIANYGVIKLETGIYPYVFAGLGFGAQW